MDGMHQPPADRVEADDDPAARLHSVSHAGVMPPIQTAELITDRISLDPVRLASTSTGGGGSNDITFDRSRRTCHETTLKFVFEASRYQGVTISLLPGTVRTDCDLTNLRNPAQRYVSPRA